VLGVRDRPSATPELDEATPHVRRHRRTAGGRIEQDEDSLVTPEAGEVLERQIHGTPDPPHQAQSTELLQLSSLSHARIVLDCADRTLPSD
jgi:hypothetical protein